MSKEERVCQFYKLSLRLNGDVFPCCLAKKNSLIGNIFDSDIQDKIESKNIICECELFKNRQIQEGEKPNIQRLHIEFSNECQAHCVCCKQHKEKMQNEDEHLSKIYQFIEKFQPKNITVIGGEVLIQKKSLEWLKMVKKNYPEISFDIVTNLCVKEEILKEAVQIFDDITVSILGFNSVSYKKIMGLNFDTTINNINYILSNTNIKLRPKFLMMPTNVYEIAPFLEWALSTECEKIYLHNIREFNSVCNLSDEFWTNTFIQIEKDIKRILNNNKEELKSKDRHYISLHGILAKKININEEYLKKEGLEKNY